MSSFLKLTHIGKSFSSPTPIEILKDICLTISKGESLAILGPSGVGKSTFLNILGGLESPSQGFIELEGKNLSFLDINNYRREKVGFIFQCFHLLEDYTALDNVLMPARILRKNVKKGSTAYERCIYLLEKVGLKDRLFHLSKQLSGGEKQRVALARSLCNDPEIILADEPTGNLDEANSQLIHQLLISLSQEMKKTLIIVTHDLDLARLCDKRYMLKNKNLNFLS